ncbi:fumarylacetoacetate hydrolase domain-containing protein 2-like [Oscarella lobularis]|uniref:fumarylacetoacetate hydrolase domain-containing protein 2-like n=1 Tax=Oscarella lobularis TaxID=121494 RepID=UPI0033133348
MPDIRFIIEKSAQRIAFVLAKGAPEIPRADVRLKAPITNPEKVICIGMNYVDHCTEQNVPVPKEPVIFSKFASAITDPGSPVSLEETENLDFEVELVIVIGKTGKKISESDAMAHVAGYTVAHDVSARDWQMKKNGGQWLIGKTMDTYCPLGPAIVTTDGITDPHNLGIRCRLNGETVQDSNTNQLVHKTPAALAFISRFITLRPGDLILTGTPPGVGCFRKPPLWLKKGDVVEVEVDEIGCISNPIQ